MFTCNVIVHPNRLYPQPAHEGVKNRKFLTSGWLMVVLTFLFTADNPRVSAQTNINNIAPPPRTLDYVPIRVLLKKTGSLKITSPNGEFSIWNPDSNRRIIRLPAGHSSTIRLESSRWRILGSGGRNGWSGSSTNVNTLEVRPERGDSLELDGSKQSRYRGKIQLVRLNANTLAVVNELDIEDYLAGVIGSEMWSNWPIPALRAQCIAARTYALYFRNCHEHTGPWDVGDTQASQVYRGTAAESIRLTKIVQDTRGIVLTYGPTGKEKLFPAYYSAVCGGHTQDAAPVFARKLAPLSGRSCPYCSRTAPPRRYRWAAVTVDKYSAGELLIDRLNQLAPLGRIADIQIEQKSEYGRIERVELTGANGQRKQIRGEDLRLALTSKTRPILSSWYRLRDLGDAWRFEDGHGWGHGVGLCQYGAKQMASLGKSSIDILLFYYPQATLLRAY